MQRIDPLGYGPSPHIGQLPREVNFSSTFRAVLNQESSLRSWDLHRKFGLDGNPVEDPDFNFQQVMDAQGDHKYRSILSESVSEEHYNKLRLKAMFEEHQRGIIADSGFTETLAAGFLVGMTDPLNIVLGAVSGGSATLARSVFKSAAMAVAITGGNETVLQQTQITRTGMESVINLAADMVFSTALGVGAYGIARGLGANPKMLRNNLGREERADSGTYGLPFGDDPDAPLVLYEPPSSTTRGPVVPEYRAVDPTKDIGPGNQAAEYDVGEHKIYVDYHWLKRDFAGQAWKKPRVKGAKPIDYDFKSADEYTAFVIQHEYLHSVHPQARNAAGEIIEDLGAYENRINDYALPLRLARAPDAEILTKATRGELSEATHQRHESEIRANYGDDVADQMGREGAFGGFFGETHPAARHTDGNIPPERLDDTARKSGYDGYEDTIDHVEAYSERVLSGDLTWITRLAHAYGLEKLKVSPMLHLLNSQLHSARWYISNLIETPVSLVGNQHGYVTPISIQQNAKIHNYLVSQIVEITTKAFAAHRLGRSVDDPSIGTTRILRELGKAQVERFSGKLPTSSSRSIVGFKIRVSRALRSGDADEDPAVMEVVKQIRKTINQVTDDAQKLGLLPEQLELFGTKSYLPRMWLQDVVEKNVDELVKVITTWQRGNSSADMPENLVEAMSKGTEAHEKYIRLQLRGVSRRLNGIEDYSPESAAPGGSFKERGIWVDDNVIAGDNTGWGGSGISFIESDIDHIIKRWVPTLTTDMEIVRNPIFGSVGFENVTARIRRESVERAEELGDEVVEVRITTPQGAPMPDKFIRTATDQDTFTVGRGQGEPDLDTIPEYDPETGEILGTVDQEMGSSGWTRSVGKRQIIVKSTKRGEDDIEKLINVRDVMRGTYSLSEDPLSITSRMARLSIDMTHLALMGNVLVSSLPDAGRLLVVNKMHAIKTLQLAFNNRDAYKMAALEAKYAGTGLDMAKAQTINSLLHQGEIPRYTGAERLVGRLTDTLFIVNGLNPWNAMMKQAAGIATIARMVHDFRLYQSGNLSNKSITQLARAGIDGRFIDEIMVKVNKHGEIVDDIDIVNSHLWGESDADLALLTKFRAILNKEIDTQIVTPGPGDVPLMFKKTPLFEEVTERLLGRKMTAREAEAFNLEKGEKAIEGDRPGRFGPGGRLRAEAAALYPELGKMFGQYKSFIAGSWSRVMLNSAQHRDSREIIGIGTMVLIGGMAKTLKDWSYNRPGPKNLTDFLIEGFDQAGLGSWVMWANNSTEMLTNNSIGVRPFVGVQENYPASARFQTSNIAGPAVGQWWHGMEGVGQLATGQMPTSLIEIAPYKSYFPLRLHNIFNWGKTFDETVDVGATQ